MHIILQFVQCSSGFMHFHLHFQVVLDGEVCVQEFSKSRALGRAYLRASGHTIAVGVVNRIISQDQN
jgi:translation elongation factor EF-1alpha